MTKKRVLVIALEVIALCIIVWLVGGPEAAGEVPKVEVIEVKSAEQIDLEHRQEIWISALEWCESRGRNTALNPKDRDGTPSYSNFQWKPSTLLYYGKMYGLIDETKTLADAPELLKNYQLQRNIVRAMIKDPAVKWHIQFPECTKNKIGLPPRK